jgi:hypothetical protein
VVRRLPLVTVISPQFVRLREDKQTHPQDVRLSQVSDRVEVALTDCDAKNFKLPNTEMLKREVFTKEAKGQTMVRKFVVLKTNKEGESDEYPAYALHYTDFSPNRKDPLSRDVVVSNSQEQIEQLYDKWKTDNIKKGWNPLNSEADSIASEPETVSAPTKKPAAKKKAATRSTKKKSAVNKSESDAPVKKRATKKKKAKSS